MRPLFEKYGIELVALSKDTVAQANKQKIRDNLSFPLLSDPELSVIKTYGRLHQNGFEFFTFFFLGIPLGWPTGFKQMAIPTTYILDENGFVRWIDQATDYRIRGDAQRIEKALHEIFDH